MASVPVSHLILFIASIIVAAAVAGALTTQVGRVSGAIDDQGLHLSQQIRTDIAIISDPGSAAVYDSGSNQLTLLVKNTGSRTIPSDPNQIDVLVDGVIQTNVTTTVVDASAWEPTTVLEVTVADVPLATGDHRVKVVVSGDEAVMEFRT